MNILQRLIVGGFLIGFGFSLGPPMNPSMTSHDYMFWVSMMIIILGIIMGAWSLWSYMIEKQRIDF